MFWGTGNEEEGNNNLIKISTIKISKWDGKKEIPVNKEPSANEDIVQFVNLEKKEGNYLTGASEALGNIKLNLNAFNKLRLNLQIKENNEENEWTEIRSGEK